MTDAALSDDLLLAKRAARADPRAWDEIVQRYGGRIYNLAARFAGDLAEAEDLTQEIFLKLYRTLGRYRGDVPLVAWALRLSRNLCIDYYRHHRTRNQAETVNDEILKHMPGRDNPQARTQAREDLRRVDRALGQMSEISATVIVLRDLQGFSYDEMATILELPSGTVKSRLNRARRELVRCFENQLEMSPSVSPSSSLEPVSP